MLERHLQAHVLVAVVEAVEQDLGLGLVRGDVVADLRGPQLAALVALPDREALHDVGMGLGHRGDLGAHLGVGVEPLVARRERPGGPGGRDRRQHRDKQRSDQPGEDGRGGAEARDAGLHVA